MKEKNENKFLYFNTKTRIIIKIKQYKKSREIRIKPSE